MRITSIHRAAVVPALLLAAAAAGAQATPPAGAPAYATTRAVASSPSLSPWTGVYRLQLTSENGQSITMRLIVERDGSGVSGMLLTEGNNVASVALTVDDRAVRARAETSAGVGTLELRETEAGLVGSFTVGKQVWKVEGSRSA